MTPSRSHARQRCCVEARATKPQVSKGIYPGHHEHRCKVRGFFTFDSTFRGTLTLLEPLLLDKFSLTGCGEGVAVGPCGASPFGVFGDFGDLLKQFRARRELSEPTDAFEAFDELLRWRGIVVLTEATRGVRVMMVSIRGRRREKGKRKEWGTGARRVDLLVR